MSTVCEAMGRVDQFTCKIGIDCGKNIARNVQFQRRIFEHDFDQSIRLSRVQHHHLLSHHRQHIRFNAIEVVEYHPSARLN